MAQHRGMDVGTAVGLQATSLGVGIGAVMFTGHANAMERVRQDREAREQATYDAAVSAALGNAEQLGRIARQAVRDLATANAEIAKLRRALEQRQGFIDRMKRVA
ncbi:hypothetical protein [Mesorhizobium sp. B2-4-17]|uniref:hypothetical protein n=1 Tax=Mesorhizobium sp. B2-4-17 TaxID=2589932 RepID=UPI0011274FE9|nr:hypothetical protein [Mesorhizobium sp. B2-4-17]TPK91481.1 hypothetical protein FJ548_04375 [Mesorhizobium sp. B2-4-17]